MQSHFSDAILTRKYWGCWCLMSFCMWSVIFPPVASEIANVTEKFIFLFLLNQLLLLFEDDSQREDILNILKFIHICCTTVSDEKLRQKLKDAVRVWFSFHKYPFLLKVFKFMLWYWMWEEFSYSSPCGKACSHTFIHLEGRPGERMFHFHATLLFMHNAQHLAGFLPYFIMHDRETTTVDSLSSKRSFSRRKWGDWGRGGNTEALALATELTRQKETNWSKIVLFCFAFLLRKSRSERKGSRKPASRQNRIAWRYRCLGHLLLSKTHKSITFYNQRFFSLWPLAHSQNSGTNIHYNRVSYKEFWNDMCRPFMINNNT